MSRHMKRAATSSSRTYSPLIEPYIVLDEEEHLIWKIGRPQSSRQVDMLEKHSSCRYWRQAVYELP